MVNRARTPVNQFFKRVFTAAVVAISFTHTPLFAQTLVLGSPLSGSVATQQWNYYSISGGAEVSLYDLTADVDLYISYDGQPTRTSYDCSSTNGATISESCFIATTGTVTIGVYGYAAGNYTLLVSVPQLLTAGTPLSGSLAIGQWNYYQATDIDEVTLYELSADLDLYVKNGGQPTRSDYDCQSAASGSSNETCSITSTGTSYIGVYGYRAGNYSIAANGTSPTTSPTSYSAYFDSPANTLVSSCMENTGYPSNGLPAGFTINSVLQAAGYLTIDDVSMGTLDSIPVGCEDQASFVIDQDGSIAQATYHYANVSIAGDTVTYSVTLVANSPTILDQHLADLREVRNDVTDVSAASTESGVSITLPDYYTAAGAAASLSVSTNSGALSPGVDYTISGNVLTLNSLATGVHALSLSGTTNAGAPFLERFTIEVSQEEPDTDTDTDGSTSSGGSSGVTGIAQQIQLAGDKGCVIVEGGKVKCWGISRSTFGVPTEVPGLTNVKEIAVGAFSACAITSSDSVKCWGWERWGMLGNHSTGNDYVENPVTVDLAGTVVDISVGTVHACAVLSTGSVYCWGADLGGALGNGSAATPSDGGPTAVVGVYSATKVSSYTDTDTCALLGSGQVSCWGGGTNNHTPAIVSGIATAIDILASNSYVCTILSDRTLKCWGDNTYGQLGGSEQTYTTTPQTVIGVTDVIGLSVGLRHACALISGGTIKCWGDNASGQLGTGSAGDPSQAVPMAGVTDATQVAAGDSSSGYIDESQMVNLLGQADAPLIGTNQTPLDSLTAVPLTDEFSASTDTGSAGGSGDSGSARGTGGSGSAGGAGATIGAGNSADCGFCGIWWEKQRNTGRIEIFGFDGGTDSYTVDDPNSSDPNVRLNVLAGTGSWLIDYTNERSSFLQDRWDRVCAGNISWTLTDRPASSTLTSKVFELTGPSLLCGNSSRLSAGTETYFWSLEEANGKLTIQGDVYTNYNRTGAIDFDWPTDIEW